jgi:predicted amidophosphoribosyltransferase
MQRSLHDAVFHVALGRAGLLQLAKNRLLCRGCLGPLGEGSEAGLCGTCWSGLVSLDEHRCPRCALSHALETGCPDPVEWTFGDAFWDYHGGRPALGAMLLPGIKTGERGWKGALLERVARMPLPSFASGADLVTVAPTAFHRRWVRGFDLAEETARHIADRLRLPFLRTLRKDAWIRRQAGRTETDRRRLPRKAITIRPGTELEGRIPLLVDDVWTTGTTLLRCAQALKDAGAVEVRVLTLFRAVSNRS